MVLITAAAGSDLRTGFNFDRLTDTDSTIVQKSGSSLIIEVDGLRYAFSGSNVRYNSFDEPISGPSHGTFLLWASGGQAIDSAMQLIVSGPTPPSPTLFGLDDFI